MDEHKSDKHGTRLIRSLEENQIIIKKKKEIALKEIEKQSGKFKGKGKDVEINIFMVVL